MHEPTPLDPGSERCGPVPGQGRSAENGLEDFPSEFLQFPNVPQCSQEDLEELILHVGLGESERIKTAFKLLRVGFGDVLREDRSPALEGHAFVVAKLAILYAAYTGREVDERLVLDALMHDFVEDSKQPRDFSRGVLMVCFGEEVAHDVEVVTQLDYRDFPGETIVDQKDARNVAQAVRLAAADWRVVLVKGCDRFLNWTSMHIHPTPEKHLEYERKSGPLLDLLSEREPLLAKAIRHLIAKVHEFKAQQI